MTATNANNKNSKINHAEAITFSKHAERRIKSRKIAISPKEMEKISTYIDLAASQGMKALLLITGKAALLASALNRTIITVVNLEQLQDNIFTNIDSSVVI